eukprot:SAG31_NODE_1021_length_10327_cov_17.940653_6_plen_64_part_00
MAVEKQRLIETSSKLLLTAAVTWNTFGRIESDIVMQSWNSSRGAISNLVQDHYLILKVILYLN